MTTSELRTIAIGDIHGCFLALDSLLEVINPQKHDLIVVLGDFIDQGRETRDVIERLIHLDSQCKLIHLMGNHEEVLLNTLEDRESLDYWMQCGGFSTLNSYRFGGSIKDIPEEHLDFIRRSQSHHETAEFIFAHATPDHDVSMGQQTDYALRWQLLDANEYRPHHSGKTVIVGHTEQRSGEILDLGSLRCIDTGCWRYGWLTAMDVSTGEIWQAQRFGGLRAEDESSVGPIGSGPQRRG